MGRIKGSHWYVILIVLLFQSCMDTPEENETIVTDFCAQVHRADSISLSDELAPVLEEMKSKTGVYVLEDGGGSLVARAWLSEYAEKTIDIQYFIFSTDNVGLIACDYLVRAADRGVKVRILVDDIMINTAMEDILDLDAHENISIKIYNPTMNMGKNFFEKVKNLSLEFRSVNQRMHNKTFTVDGKVVITGGRNIADEYYDYDHAYNFRDRDVLLLGKASNEVQNSFNTFWKHDLSVPILEIAEVDSVTKSKRLNTYATLHEYACNPDNFWPQIRERITNFPNTFHDIYASGGLIWVDSVEFITDVPGKNDGTQGLNGGGVTAEALFDLVKNAKKSVVIQSPYLITTPMSLALFEATVKRGVKIRILTNSMASTDNLEAFSGYQRDRKKLLNTGVEIYEFKPDAKVRFDIMTGALQTKLNFTPIFGLHAKSMVIDDSITVIGTFNLDPRSANLNTECMAVIYSEAVSEGVLAGMEQELLPENAWHTTLYFNPDSEAGVKKQVKSWTRKIVPKGIL